MRDYYRSFRGSQPGAKFGWDAENGYIYIETKNYTLGATLQKALSQELKTFVKEVGEPDDGLTMILLEEDIDKNAISKIVEEWKTKTARALRKHNYVVSGDGKGEYAYIIRRSNFKDLFVRDTPGPSQPVPSQPSQPVPSQPSQPVPSQPSQPVPSQPVQPVPSQPVPVQPVPSQPVPSQPVPSQPVPSQPVQPVPSQPNLKVTEEMLDRMYMNDVNEERRQKIQKQATETSILNDFKTFHRLGERITPIMPLFVTEQGRVLRNILRSRRCTPEIFETFLFKTNLAVKDILFVYEILVQCLLHEMFWTVLTTDINVIKARVESMQIQSKNERMSELIRDTINKWNWKQYITERLDLFPEYLSKGEYKALLDDISYFFKNPESLVAKDRNVKIKDLFSTETAPHYFRRQYVTKTMQAAMNAFVIMKQEESEISNKLKPISKPTVVPLEREGGNKDENEEEEQETKVEERKEFVSYWTSNEERIKPLLPGASVLPIYTILDVPERPPTYFILIDGSAVISDDADDVDVKIYGMPPNEQITQWERENRQYLLYKNMMSSQYETPFAEKKIDIRIMYSDDRSAIPYQKFLTVSMLQYNLVQQLQDAKRQLKEKHLYGVEPAFGLLSGIYLMSIFLWSPFDTNDWVQLLSKAMNFTLIKFTLGKEIIVNAFQTDDKHPLVIEFEKAHAPPLKIKRFTRLGQRGLYLTLTGAITPYFPVRIPLKMTEHLKIVNALHKIDSMFNTNGRLDFSKVTNRSLSWQHVGTNFVAVLDEYNIEFSAKQQFNYNRPSMINKLERSFNTLFNVKVEGMFPFRNDPDFFMLNVYYSSESESSLNNISRLLLACFTGQNESFVLPAVR